MADRFEQRGLADPVEVVEKRPAMLLARQYKPGQWLGLGFV